MDLLYARWQMGLSLAFHIIVAVVGMAMPLMMVAAEIAYWRTGRTAYLELAKRWGRGTAILFAVGAVSGTVLSFELGLLWPRFMEAAGPIIGMPFSLESFAFSLEAIFLGLYLYGWHKLNAPAHVFAGIMVALSGPMSAVFVVTANAWMNTPAGFRLENGNFMDIAPFAAMFNPAAGSQVVHMLLAGYAALGVAVAGIHARLLLRDNLDAFHRAAFVIALAVGLPALLLQPLSGDWSGRVVARTQPAKFAALEGQFDTEAYAPLRIGGIPDLDRGETPYALEIPGGLSLLAHGHPAIPVTGLNAAAVAAFAFLWLEHYTLARVAAISQVVLILWGWALAQYPYAIRPNLTLHDAAAPTNVLVSLLQVLGVGAVVLIPSLLYLFGIFGPRGHPSSKD
jgi:cytochrome d ubiquinol oxidase subunit I